MRAEKKEVFIRTLIEQVIKPHMIRTGILIGCIVLFIIGGVLPDGVAKGLVFGLTSPVFILSVVFTLISYKNGREEIEKSDSIVYLLTRQEEKAMRARMRAFNILRDGACDCLIGANPGNQILIKNSVSTGEPLSKDKCRCTKKDGVFICNCVYDDSFEPHQLHDDCSKATQAKGCKICGGPYAFENYIIRTGNKRDGILAILYYWCSGLPGELLLAVADRFYDDETQSIREDVLTVLRYVTRNKEILDANLEEITKFVLEVSRGAVVRDDLLRLFPNLRAVYRSQMFYAWTSVEMAFISTMMGLAAMYLRDHISEKPEINFYELFNEDGSLKESGLIEGQDGDTVYSVITAWDAKYNFLPKDDEE